MLRKDEFPFLAKVNARYLSALKCAYLVWTSSVLVAFTITNLYLWYLSSLHGYLLTISTNGIGEFPVEVTVILSALAGVPSLFKRAMEK